MAPRPAVGPGLAGVAAALFVASATATIVWCRSMSAMDMSMPGGWTMSMAWMRAPDQTWAGAAGVFVAMWVVMMVAMMLPAVLPVLRRYADAAAADGVPVGHAVALAGAAYFVVWAAAGVAVFPIGASLSALAMTRPAVASAVPLAIGAALLAAGALQFTQFKARALACCAMPAGSDPVAADGWSAWRNGLRFGVQCVRCCGNLMAILPILGVMDLGVMAAVTLAITAERIAPAGARVARIVGTGLVLAGVVHLARAIAIA